jgi:23S rRNA pseudouridine2605 synthase
MEAELRDASRGERLQKVLAAAGIGSRRACEELILDGAVRVNGRVVRELPAWVDAQRDDIRVRGRRIRSERMLYVMLNKPKETISTNSDPQGRRRAIDLVEHPAGARLFPVGRLDKDSTGLLLLTNDGELANRLTHPRYEVHKTYHVWVKGVLDDEAIERLETGVFLTRTGPRPGSRTAPSQVKLIRRETARTVLEITLREGRNRQVRRMLQRVGYPVKKLRRVRLGPLVLKGLGLGQWRELTAREVSALRRASGLRRGR